MHLRHDLLQCTLENWLGVKLVHTSRQSFCLKGLTREARGAHDEWLFKVGCIQGEVLTDQTCRLAAIAYWHLVVH